jgi:hypothetical protein
MQTALQWAQPLVTVVSLTFGGGILYGDVQDLKRTVSRGEGLDKQVQVMEVKLSNAESDQRKTVEALVKVADAVNQLNKTVVKLETKLELGER